MAGQSAISNVEVLNEPIYLIGTKEGNPIRGNLEFDPDNYINLYQKSIVSNSSQKIKFGLDEGISIFSGDYNEDNYTQLNIQSTFIEITSNASVFEGLKYNSSNPLSPTIDSLPNLGYIQDNFGEIRTSPNGIQYLVLQNSGSVDDVPISNDNETFLHVDETIPALVISFGGNQYTINL